MELREDSTSPYSDEDNYPIAHAELFPSHFISVLGKADIFFVTSSYKGYRDPLSWGTAVSLLKSFVLPVFISMAVSQSLLVVLTAVLLYFWFQYPTDQIQHQLDDSYDYIVGKDLFNYLEI